MEVATDHLHNAQNMTDRFGALRILVHNQLPGYRNALTDFEERFGTDPLPMDKWYSVQATAPVEDVLNVVMSLMEHEEFSLYTPNRVRALIGSFAMANQTQFNRIDGEGYRFVASMVAEIDSINPHVAARLLTSFRSYRALEPERRSKAEQALASLTANVTLSKGTGDICDRILNDTT